MAGKIRNIDAQAQFREGASQVLHDDLIGGNSVQEHNRSGVWARQKVRTAHHQKIHAACGGVDNVAVFGIPAGGIKPQQPADK